ncbi:MAG: helix-turn-helix transcriptional regulator [Firmicutes bacterium]|nr:helix-turn-helix transcriptional regulator [Bacillota bacterium]
MDFKDKIKARRKELGLTLEDVGQIVGVSKTTIQRWESGEIKNQRRDKIIKLAQALQTTPTNLMGWADAAATAQTQQHQLLGANEQLENLFYDIEQLQPEQQKNFLKMMRAALLLFLEQKDNGNN